jgi:two-component system chemotaxis sensor kinase CheA
MDDLMSDFLAETREMLDAISGEIVAWEADPADRARLDAIFRFVHTVKGSCGFLNLPRLARLSHAAEDVLAEVRAGRRTPDTHLVSGVLAVVDRIGELITAIGSGESLDDKEDQKLVAALDPGSPAPSAAISVATERRGPARSIRLPIELLDRLMDGVSALAGARDDLARELRKAGLNGPVDAAFERLSTTVGDLRDTISRTRMQRLDQLFAALPRMVRDLAAELGREVVLELEGGDVELDRETIEVIRDPITHIIRNAVDHGIEPPAQRRALGKPAAGTLRIGARQSGNQIVIEASDDGAGIDGDRIAAWAVESGLVSGAEAAALSPAARLDLIFRPGLSTAREVSAISGRGVGMDVVRANIARIGGVAEVQSRPGAGTRVTLRVPLTLTIVPALIVSIGGQRFAIPRSAVDEITAVGPDARIERLATGMRAIVRGRRLPFVDGASVLFGDDADAPGPADVLVLLRPGGGGTYALAVSACHDHAELVVKPAAPEVTATGLYAGKTLPDSGPPMLLLDPAGIATAGLADRGVALAMPERAPLCLLRDRADGWTRDILAPLVLAAGYRVAFAGEPIDETPAVEIAQSPELPTASGARLVRLRADPGEGEDVAGNGIDRDDREAILAALRAHRARVAA